MKNVYLSCWLPCRVPQDESHKLIYLFMVFELIFVAFGRNTIYMDAKKKKKTKITTDKNNNKTLKTNEKL